MTGLQPEEAGLSRSNSIGQKRSAEEAFLQPSKGSDSNKQSTEADLATNHIQKAGAVRCTRGPDNNVRVICDSRYADNASSCHPCYETASQQEQAVPIQSGENHHLKSEETLPNIERPLALLEEAKLKPKNDAGLDRANAGSSWYLRLDRYVNCSFSLSNIASAE